MKALICKLDQECERWLCLMFYTLIVMTIVSEVVRRFGLSYSSIWGEELARYSFVFLAWFGAALAIRNRSHIRIDVLLNALGRRGKAVLYLFGDLASLVLALAALWISIEPVLLSIEFGSVTEGLRISKAWFLISVPLGFTLIVLRLLQSMWRDIQDLGAGRAVFSGNSMVD
ncbi:TRAP transporter small permease [Amphritea sp. 1_MG-2023]|uniref:TRAP transporter small permease n=1 Tax=Amphritea sp. 1_MG-2023 TaxID=3062670 RepID=UPI0026E33152|nr:TRAP transporter small permease [Amphritea sp. 1_MG-2023]MDO6565165.1 TRAP transporter small permease [Amphritea sp. 1_MG-2023]